MFLKKNRFWPQNRKHNRFFGQKSKKANFFLRKNRIILGPFWGQFGTILGLCWALLGPFWGHFGHCWDPFGVMLEHFWHFRDHFGPFSGIFCDHFGIILAPSGPFWDHFGLSSMRQQRLYRGGSGGRGKVCCFGYAYTLYILSVLMTSMQQMW